MIIWGGYNGSSLSDTFSYTPGRTDGIDDSWQVQYFGQPPNPLAAPNADADGTGQNNLFKFIAGLNPLDGSRFTLSILPVTVNHHKRILSSIHSLVVAATRFSSLLT